jgi:hypothetical protein
VAHPYPEHRTESVFSEECVAPLPATYRQTLARAVGQCIYFIRTDDNLIKIGHTGNLMKRRRAYGPDWKQILAVMPGTREQEHCLHLMFAAHLTRGREYFEPAPKLMNFINRIRAQLGVPEID